MTPKEMIEIINLYDKGFEIEYLIKHEPTDKWSKVYEEHLFDFENHEYRKKPEPVSIPVTEEELEEMKTKLIWCKSSVSGKIFPQWDGTCWFVKPLPYRLNPETKCWEDWSDE